MATFASFSGVRRPSHLEAYKSLGDFRVPERRVQVARQRPSRSASSESLGGVGVAQQHPSQRAAFESLSGVVRVDWLGPCRSSASESLGSVRHAWRWHPSRSAAVSESLGGSQSAAFKSLSSIRVVRRWSPSRAMSESRVGVDLLSHARVARSCPNRWVASELLSVFSVARRRPSHSESIGVVRVAVSSESPLGGVTGVRVSCALFELLKSLVNRSVSSETLGGVRVSWELFELLKSLVKSESPGGVRVARRPLSRSAASESNVGIRVARWCPSRSAASGSLGGL